MNGYRISCVDNYLKTPSHLLELLPDLNRDERGGSMVELVTASNKNTLLEIANHKQSYIRRQNYVKEKVVQLKNTKFTLMY